MTTDPWYFRPNEERIPALTEMACHALEAWGGTRATPELFLEGENAVFRVEVPGHGLCAVRVHRAGYHTAEHLQWQVDWCRALTAEGVVRTPATIDTLDGRSFVVVTHPEVPEQRFVSVLTWEPGRSLKDVASPGLTTYETLGTLMGRIHGHGATWTERDRFAGMRWDVDTFLGDDAVLGAFWDTPLLSDDDRPIMARFRDEAVRTLTEFGYGPDRFGIVHGDLLPQNLLDHEGEITVLDFDDAGHGWYAMEIATVLMPVAHRPEYAMYREAVLTAYRRYRPVADADLALLPLLIALRTATYVGWVHTHPFTPAAQERGPAITRNGVRAVARYLERADASA